MITKWPLSGNVEQSVDVSHWLLSGALLKSLLSVLEAFLQDKNRVRLLCTSNVEVKLIHVSNREAGLCHTSHSEAALGHTLDTFNLSPALLLGQRAQTDNTQPSRLTSPLAARVLLLFVAFLLFLPSTVDNLLTPQ